ncbi:MAG: hypothetical protein ACOVPA_17785 [Rubrivivax sp.]
MASEKLGLIYEAITELALRKLKVSYWHNCNVPGMKIIPDFTVGGDRNSPNAVIMVSHCTSEHNSDMKFWRNIGELKEAKLIDSIPICIVVLFDAMFKRDLLTIQRHAFDKFVEVEEWSSFARCKALLSSASKNVPQLASARADWVEANVDKKVLNDLVRDIASNLRIALSSRNTLLDEFWGAVSKTANLSNSPPGRRATFLRRGMAKALLFDRLPVEKNCLRVHEDLGLVRKLPGRGVQYAVSDMELGWFLEKFSQDDRAWLMERYFALPEIHILKATINGLEQFDDLYSAFSEAIKRCTSIDTFCKEMVASHSGAGKYKNLGADLPLRGWFVVFAISAIKAISTGDRGFGYSKIVNSLATSSTIARSPRTVEYGLRDWIYGGHRNNFSITTEEINAVGAVLFEACTLHFADIDLSSKSSDVYAQIVRDTLETKLASHPSFLPHKDIIVKMLDDNGIRWVHQRYWPSPFFQAAVANGERLNVRSSSTEVIFAKSTLIRWISVSDEGKNHKCKEFCGKGIGLRYQLVGGRWSRRPEIKKQVLVVDGTFDQSELQALANSGWDEIYYPDEMDQLAKAIV